MGYMRKKIEDFTNSKEAKKAARNTIEALAESRFKPEASERTKKIYMHSKAMMLASGTITEEEIREIEKKYGSSVIAAEQDYGWIEEIPEADISIITLALYCYVENTVLLANKKRAKEIIKAIEG
jgi:nicotinate-nucleotide pyrophosphorylase